MAWGKVRGTAAYGHRQVHVELSQLRVAVGLQLVPCLMRELKLVPCQPKPRRPTTTIAGDGAGIPT